MMRSYLTTVFLFMLSFQVLAAQPRSVSGTVTDTEGVELPGVNVLIKGTFDGTITDVDGKFSLSNVPEDAVLVFSFMGMETQEIAVAGQTVIDVAMEAGAIDIEEVIAVGYGTQRKETITGSVSAINADKIAVAPVASASNALVGKLPGLIALQSSGQPGFDQAALSIRGFGNALVIVDGVESDFNNIDPSEIESVSILKDGAASIYGARAGNGVILVTTKRGLREKPVIEIDISQTMQGITLMPKPVSAGQFAEIKREAWLQGGNPPELAPYTEEEIQRYYDGTDPDFPNTDWYDYLIRDWAPQQNYKMSVRGGSERVQYYGYIGYMNQETIWKRNGGNYDRFNIQSNLDADITDHLSLSFDLSTIVENRKFPWRPLNSDVWQDFWNSYPTYPATLPDPTKIPTGNGRGISANISTNREISGYHDDKIQHLKGTMALDYSFDRWLKGLSAKGFINVMQNYAGMTHFTKPVDFYTYNYASDIYTLAGSLGDKAAMTKGRSEGRTITGQVYLKYEGNIAPNHHLNVLAVHEVIDYYSESLSAGRIGFLTPAIEQLYIGSLEDLTNDGRAWAMGRKSYIGRINYSYKSKYLLETILRADASAKFPSEIRWGYFPSVSLGWRISEEAFTENQGVITDMKLRLSYGQSGNDAVANFDYLSGYTLGHPYVYNNIVQQGITATSLANPSLTWENMTIYNAGLDFELFNKKIYGVGELFYRTREGIPGSRLTTLPPSFGATLPPENINSQNDRGFELVLGTSKSSGDFNWDINGQLSWSRARWIHNEEPDFDDPDQERQLKLSGRWTDVKFGFVSDGLFTSPEEIAALEFDQDQAGNLTLRPGDIKYKDMNEDGILDWKDRVDIGKGEVPHWMLGINASLSYKNFDLFALFQGAFGYYNYVTLLHGEVPPAVYYDLRWTEETNSPDALIPRLGGAATNSYVSDFYFKKAGYVRLKTLSIGYNLPGHWVEKIGTQRVRIYFAGVNLLTLDKLRDYDIDPESPSGSAGYYYPQQRTFSFGVNMAF